MHAQPRSAIGVPRLTRYLSPLEWAALILCGLFLSLPNATPAGGEQPWLLVDTTALTLAVMRGEQVLLELENIAIGSNGATRDKRIGDEKTPLGEFTINEIRDSERFHRFLAFAYPPMDYASAALRDGRISRREYLAISRAWRGGEPPPQNTGLGGNLGIHGLGAGDPEIHRLFNWTNGCIALTNEQMERLAPLVHVGTRVSIR